MTENKKNLTPAELDHVLGSYNVDDTVACSYDEIASCASCGKAALSEDDLGLVSAAGVATVPTMKPEPLLGRHDIPDNREENRP